MSEIEMPMNAAHEHAANAEDHLAQGYLIPAAEEHQRASEAYLAAAEQSNDESASRTLRMLHSKHSKAARDLQRKVQKLREDGKDPNERQKPDPQPSTSTPKARTHLNVPPQAPSPPPNTRLNDLQNTVDESFMLLGGQRSDPGDAFNQFWTIMQGMLDNLSQPVAFSAAIDLNGANGNDTNASTSNAKSRDGNLSSDTDGDEPLVSKFKRRMGLSKSRTTYPPPASASQNINPVDEFDDDVLDLGDDLSESFYVVSSSSEPSAASYKKENASLKQELESLQQRLEAAERHMHKRKEQDQQLRDSIVMARREAQRVMGASMVGQRPHIDLSALNLNVPPLPIQGLTPSREAQYTRRIKELEDEVRGLKSENEKQKVMISKFRERWEKLKDSAKRKKEAKAASGSTPIRERIVEEPEAEQELDGNA